MSVLLRTILAFPSGRTTNELLALLDTDFDPRKRTEIYAELASLSEAGAVSKGRDGRWRGIAVQSSRDAAAAAKAGLYASLAPEADVLRAAPAVFRSTGQDPGVALSDDIGARPDPSALLRYYRSALRTDPRGAISQDAERHGQQWHLISGAGPLTGSEEECLRITVALEHLSDDFRKALVKRQANEQTMALGWPIAVGVKLGAPVIWPIGLINAEWTRTETHLELTVERDDVLVNPEWLKSAARPAGWTEGALRAVFAQTEGVGLQADDFLLRLKEAMAGAFRSKIDGRLLGSDIDPLAVGIHDMAGLFLPTDTTFTAGAVRDLDKIAAWPLERIGRTALAPLLGLPPRAETRSAPAINTGPLNREQIEAVRAAVKHGLTVVTGPPGTGKSQAIVSMVASVIADGGSVLVASKNHQALDAVEHRLGSMAPDIPFLVRTLDPARQIDRSFSNVLVDLVREPGRPGIAPDAVAQSRLATLAQQRGEALDGHVEVARLHSAIAQVLERIEVRRQAGADMPALPASAPEPGWLKRLMARLSMIFRDPSKGDPSSEEAIGEGASVEALSCRLAKLRSDLDGLAKPADPVALTDEIAALVHQLLPRLMASRILLSEEDRSQLGEDHANLELMQGASDLSPALARDVVNRRPLWLVSILGAPKRVPLDDGLFDMVIFDEASQCDIASALPLLARAKRAVVVGDSKQLSFISQLGIAHDRNLMQAQGLSLSGMGRFAQSRSSLFDLANSTRDASKVMLRDQYRSATDIVDYINTAFYGGQLRVAADQDKMKVPRGVKPGIAWTDVPAPSVPMTTNSNAAEAAAIVAQLQLLLQVQGYEGSIGVIAPFRPQVQVISEAIHAAISSSLTEKAELRVGTVDSFQGQERDLILFSPCLGATSAMSAVTFVQKDWRRLNVAISRARAVAHVFGDLAYARSGKVSSLQKLARVATEPRARVAEGTFDSECERRAYYALLDAGFKPIPQFEIAGRRLDFALFGAGDIKLDLEIDGRAWHSDTDGNRNLADHWRDAQLKSLGWRVERIWADELATDLEACIERVRKQLSQIAPL